jgi:hypothetical protein
MVDISLKYFAVKYSIWIFDAFMEFYDGIWRWNPINSLIYIILVERDELATPTINNTLDFKLNIAFKGQSSI